MSRCILITRDHLTYRPKHPMEHEYEGAYKAADKIVTPATLADGVFNMAPKNERREGSLVLRKWQLRKSITARSGAHSMQFTGGNNLESIKDSRGPCNYHFLVLLETTESH